jgi:CarD family transcriptional regulator
MNSLKVGDKVVYPNQGLGVVEDIREQLYNGERFKIFHLRILCNNTLVLVPTASAEEIGIRRPNSDAGIKDVFSFIRRGEVDIRTNWKGRYKEHLNLMKSGNLLDLALVLKSLYCLSRVKPLSFREKKMMEKARELIVSEVSEATDLTVSQAEHKVHESLSRSFRGIKARLTS